MIYFVRIEVALKVTTPPFENPRYTGNCRVDLGPPNNAYENDPTKADQPQAPAPISLGPGQRLTHGTPTWATRVTPEIKQERPTIPAERWHDADQSAIPAAFFSHFGIKVMRASGAADKVSR